MPAAAHPRQIKIQTNARGIAMLGWIKGKMVEASAARESERKEAALKIATEKQKLARRLELEKWVEQRFFGRSGVFRVPVAVQDYMRNKTGSELSPDLREDLWDWWEGFFERYPQAPMTQDETREREIDFWTSYSHIFSTKTPDGRAVLRPKQFISDEYIKWEKWILRGYFAATGNIIEPIIVSLTRHINVSIERDNVRKRVGTAEYLKEYSQYYERKLADFERFSIVDIPAHHNKWGNWFFSNVENAFILAHRPPENYGPSSATSGISPQGHDDLTYKPST